MNENLLRACYYLAYYPADDAINFQIIEKLKRDDWADLYTAEGAIQLLKTVHSPQKMAHLKAEFIDNVERNTKPVRETTRVPDWLTKDVFINEVKSPIFDLSVKHTQLFYLACGLNERLEMTNDNVILDDEFFIQFNERFAKIYQTHFLLSNKQMLASNYFVTDQDYKLIDTSFMQGVLELSRCRNMREIKQLADLRRLQTAKNLYKKYENSK